MKQPLVTGFPRGRIAYSVGFGLGAGDTETEGGDPGPGGRSGLTGSRDEETIAEACVVSREPEMEAVRVP